MRPNRKQMPNGNVQAFYDGIQVRKVPLRVPQHLHQQVVSQQQNKPPGSPILTHLLHRKPDSPTKVCKLV